VIEPRILHHLQIVKSLEVYLPTALLVLFVVIALRALYEAVGPLILPFGALALASLALWLWLRFKS